MKTTGTLYWLGVDAHLTLREREEHPIIIPVHSPGAYRTFTYGSESSRERNNLTGAQVADQDPELYGRGMDEHEPKEDG